MEKIKQLSKEERIITIFAFRYALGRTSMAPLTVTDYILEKIDQFTRQEKDQMADEIDSCSHVYLGHKCDIELWTNFAKQLRSESE
jgi:hypothetical protein